MEKITFDKARKGYSPEQVDIYIAKLSEMYEKASEEARIKNTEYEVAQIELERLREERNQLKSHNEELLLVEIPKLNAIIEEKSAQGERDFIPASSEELTVPMQEAAQLQVAEVSGEKLSNEEMIGKIMVDAWVYAGNIKEQAQKDAQAIIDSSKQEIEELNAKKDSIHAELRRMQDVFDSLMKSI